MANKALLKADYDVYRRALNGGLKINQLKKTFGLTETQAQQVAATKNFGDYRRYRRELKEERRIKRRAELAAATMHKPEPTRPTGRVLTEADVTKIIAKEVAQLKLWVKTDFTSSLVTKLVREINAHVDFSDEELETAGVGAHSNGRRPNNWWKNNRNS